MIAGHRHGPCNVLRVQAREKSGGIFDIAAGIQHVFRSSKLIAVIVVIDLHATQIDEFGALPARIFEDLKRVLARGREDRLALDVEGPGLKRSALAGLRQSHRIENAFRHTVFNGRSGDFALADAL